MKAFRLILCVVVGMMLMLGTNSCDNNKKSQDKSGSQSESSVKQRTNNSKREASDKLLLLDFYATWCGPCQAMTPVMEKMEEKYGDRIEFKRIDVDENNELAEQYNVQSIPNIVILSPDEEVLENIIGYQDADKMDAMLTAVLNK